MKANNLAVISPASRAEVSLPKAADILGIDFSSPENFTASLPFSARDVTAGAENELQVAVAGSRESVDFPVTIEESNYFRNIISRAQTGETSHRLVSALEDFLAENPEGIWENSWVRFPAAVLNDFTKRVLDRDLLADKRSPDGPRRSDTDRFIRWQEGKRFLRVPVSYLLKLSLAHAVGAPDTDPRVQEIGKNLLEHFSNDNTSPEIFSFHPVPLKPRMRMGQEIARETLKRYLFTQLLLIYANKEFGLKASGQEAILYFAPTPPERQKYLNDLISDSFYRELFMSPCLSGWDQGEMKHRYMHLCHTVLSRSQLNAVSKLREAGIITRNLVVLPNISNTSLANNGTHISLGSRKLTAALFDPASGFGTADEKQIGDLAIKIMEHFLPLFPGTYSAAPYRLDFRDFHPEKALGFLRHWFSSMGKRVKSNSCSYLKLSGNALYFQMVPDDLSGKSH